MSDEREYRYFSPSPGHAVARYGTTATIGATRGPHGYVINPDSVTAIPITETQRYAREYLKALERKELVERSKEEFDAYQAKRKVERKAENEAEAKARADEEAANEAADSSKKER